MFAWRQVNDILRPVIDVEMVFPVPAPGDDVMPLAFDIIFRPFIDLLDKRQRMFATVFDYVPYPLSVFIGLCDELFLLHGFGLLPLFTQ